MIVPVMAISNLVLTQQIYSEETNGAHAHYREPVPLTDTSINKDTLIKRTPRAGPSLFYSLLLTLSNECLSKTGT